MSERREMLREYLRGRQALGDPEVFVESGARSVLIEHVRSVVAAEGGDGVHGAPGGDPTAGRSLAELSRTGSPDEILALPDLGALRTVAESCVRCELHRTRTNVVFADGSAEAKLLCVGEAPGANEDATGLPFVGRAGKLLDRLLMSVGFPRAEVFICNVLKCRPPGNRNPLPDEIERCSPFMLRQVELVAPRAIVAFGTFAAQTLLGRRESLGRLRGRTHLYRGYPLVVTYHPAALLRNPGWTRPTWEDLQLARRIVDGEADGPAGTEAARPPRADERSTGGGPGTDDLATDDGSDGPASAPDQLTLGGPDG